MVFPSDAPLVLAEGIMPRNPVVSAAWIGMIGAILAAAIGLIRFSKDQNSNSPTERQRFPMAADSKFFPSGWMGDGKDGRKYLSLANVTTDVRGETKIAVRIDYQAGPVGWAGVYWQYPDGNWGTQPGMNLTGAREIVFLSRGEKGGEVVEFKTGGIHGAYRDSFERSLGKVALDKSWKEYRIDIAKENLSNVIGVFACVAPAAPGGPLSFYIADLTIR